MQIVRRVVLPPPKRLAVSLVQAVLLSILFRAVFVVDFQRFNLKAPMTQPSATEYSGRVDLEEEVLRKAGSWVLFLRVRQAGEERRTADVILNGTKFAVIESGPAPFQEISAEVPSGLLRPGANDFQARGEEGFRTPQEVRLQNYYGYARGLLNLVLVPRLSGTHKGPSWPALAGVFLALFILQAARAKTPEIPKIDRIQGILKILALLFLLGAAATPFLTKFRLLFLANRIWLFLVLLNFSVVVSFLNKAAFLIKRDLSFETLAAKPARRLVVSLAIPAAIFLFFLSFMLAVKAHFGGTYSRFLRIEDKRLEAFAPLYFLSGRIPADVVPMDGYDGEFNYFMAFDPFLSKYRSQPSIYASFIDEPSYRYGRIGFPLLVKLFSLDRPELYPKTIVWLIVVSHFIGAFFLLRIVLTLGKHPFWTFLYLLVPGFYYSLQWGLPESVGLVFLLAGLDNYLEGRPVGAVILLAASLFIRETGFLLVLALMGHELLKKRDFKAAWIIGCSVLPYLLWRGFLTHRLFDLYGWKSLVFGPADFTVPFFGFFDLYAHLAVRDYAAVFVPTAAIYPLLVTAIFGFAVYRFSKDKGLLSSALLLYSLVSVSLNYAKIWNGIGNGIRGTFEAFVFLFLVVLARKDGWKAAQKYIAAVFFAIVFFFLFFIMDVSEYFRAAFLIW